jgi:hypothetical protein
MENRHERSWHRNADRDIRADPFYPDPSNIIAGLMAVGKLS